MKYTILQDTRGLPDLESLERHGVNTKEAAVCFTYQIDGKMQMAKFRYTVDPKSESKASATEQLTDQFMDLEPNAEEISMLYFVDVGSKTLKWTKEDDGLDVKSLAAPKPNYIEQMLLARSAGMLRKKKPRKKRA